MKFNIENNDCKQIDHPLFSDHYDSIEIWIAKMIADERDLVA